MYISQARRFIGFTARNANDPSMYSPEQKDFALQTMGDDLCRRARIVPRTDNFSLASGISVYNNVLPSTFRPDRISTMFLSGVNVNVGFAPNNYNAYQWVEGGPDGTVDAFTSRTVDLDVVSVTNVQDFDTLTQAQAQPQAVTFTSWSALKVAPISDNIYTVNTVWFDFFTIWTPGVPLVKPTIAAGVITALTVTDQAATTSPNVSVYPAALTPVVITGDGSNATATANGTYGSNLTLSVTAGGTGYTYARISIAGVDVTDYLLNVPDDVLRKAITFGGPAFLQYDDPEKKYTVSAMEKFEAFILEIIGSVGGFGTQVVASTPRRR